MHHLRLLRVFFVTSFLAELAYRANFGVQMVQTVVTFATTAAGLAIIFDNTRTLGGWTPTEMVALLGIFYLMSGMLNVWIKPSMARFMEDVRNGTLDYTLTKPGDSQFLVSFRHVVVWSLTDAVLGVVLLVGATARLGAAVGLAQAASFLLSLAAGGIIVYSFILMLATLTFWIIKVENILVIFSSLYDAGRYPVGIYPPWLRAILTFLVPVAFATTIPAEALSHRLTSQGVVGAVLLAVVLFTVSRLFWKIGVRSYTGASA